VRLIVALEGPALDLLARLAERPQPVAIANLHLAVAVDLPWRDLG